MKCELWILSCEYAVCICVMCTNLFQSMLHSLMAQQFNSIKYKFCFNIANTISYINWLHPKNHIMYAICHTACFVIYSLHQFRFRIFALENWIRTISDVCRLLPRILYVHMKFFHPIPPASTYQFVALTSSFEHTLIMVEFQNREWAF